MKLDDFFPYILPEVLGCPDPVLRNALRLTAFDFCNRTHSWTEISDPLPLIDGVKDYDLDVPTGAYAQTVRDVWLGSRRLKPVSMAQLQEWMPDWQTAAASEPVYYNLAVERGVLSVYPTPVNVGTRALVCRTVFVPTAAATVLPDFLGQDQLEVIAAGTKYRLMLMPGVTWSNPQLGAFYKTQFDAGVTDAQAEEAHDRVPGSLTVPARSFGF
jgi:hypothetical protein